MILIGNRIYTLVNFEATACKSDSFTLEDKLETYMLVGGPSRLGDLRGDLQNIVTTTHTCEQQTCFYGAIWTFFEKINKNI